MMADTSADPFLGRVLAGYRIEARIGRGGMGVVYRAHHLSLERRAAVKIIAPELAEAGGFRERFNHEARIAAALRHPNIVTVYDAGEVDGLIYLAMQYIEGSDLAAVLREQGRLRPYRAIEVCRQIASALDAAHALGLIHRDVKPANVLIEGHTAFLTDFGLTKRLDGDANRHGTGQMGGHAGCHGAKQAERVEAIGAGDLPHLPEGRHQPEGRVRGGQVQGDLRQGRSSGGHRVARKGREQLLRRPRERP